MARHLVLLPGLDGTGIMFRPLMTCLPPSVVATPIAYPSDEPLGYADLLPLVQSKLPQEPFVLLGESFSGPLALMIAATRPPNLRGVILCATFVRNPIRFEPRWLKHLARPIVFAPFATLSRAKLLFGRHATPELRAASAEAKATIRPAVVAKRVREALSVDVTSQLRSCPTPIVYLRATADRLIWQHNCRGICSIRPDVGVADIPGPHFILQAQPGKSADVIAEFMRYVAISEPAE